MLHHLHPRTREQEHDDAGDIKTAGVISPRAHDVDRTIRPGLDARVDRPRAKRDRKGSDLGGGFALARQRRQKIAFYLIPFRGRCERSRRRLHLGGR